MANAGAPMDGGDEVQEGQHGSFPEASLGLEGLIRSPRITSSTSWYTAQHFYISIDT